MPANGSQLLEELNELLQTHLRGLARCMVAENRADGLTEDELFAKFQAQLTAAEAAGHKGFSVDVQSAPDRGVQMTLTALPGTPLAQAIEATRVDERYTLEEGYNDHGSKVCDIYAPDGEQIANEISLSSGRRLLTHLNRNRN